ncbi:methyltransferase domain-containing protein [Tunturiibacter lichenicola]
MLPYRNQTFDFVFCSHVLEHVALEMSGAITAPLTTMAR